MPEEPEAGPRELFLSISVALIVWFLVANSLSSLLIDPLLRDSSLLTQSRYSINRDALDTISNDGKISIVGMGSSMAFKALDGKCIGDKLGDDVLVYNLAQPSSRAYTDMLHIPRLVNSTPEIVMIEIGPNLLGNTSLASKEYVELRFKLDTMKQDSSDLGGWVEIIDPEHREWVALNEIERMKFRQEYVPESIEELLVRLVEDEKTRAEIRTEGQMYGWVPILDSETWNDYLQLPIFPPDRYGFDGMSGEEREEYNATTMMKTGNYRPAYHSSQAHAALDYEISTLLENDIHVIIVGLPHHPTALTYVEDGGWDGFNETISKYSQWPGVTIFDQTWETGWEDEHFYDRNHLDDEGRIEFCHRITPVIEQVLNTTDEPIHFDLDPTQSIQVQAPTGISTPKLLVIAIDTEAGSRCRELPTDSSAEAVARCIYGIFGQERAGIIEMMDAADEVSVQLSFFLDIMGVFAHSNHIVEVMQYIDSRGHDVQLLMLPSIVNSTSWEEIQNTEQWNQSGATKDVYMNCWTQETADYWFSKSMEIFDEAGVKRPIAFRGGGYRYCDTIIRAMDKYDMTQSYNYKLFSSGRQNFSYGYIQNFEWENGVMEFPVTYVVGEDGFLRDTSRIDETAWSLPIDETFERFFEEQSSTRVMTMILHSFSFLSLNESGKYYLEDAAKLDSFRDFLNNFPSEYQIVSATELQEYIDAGTITSELSLSLELISHECQR
jgi:hypothetical protein